MGGVSRLQAAVDVVTPGLAQQRPARPHSSGNKTVGPVRRPIRRYKRYKDSQDMEPAPEVAASSEAHDAHGPRVGMSAPMNQGNFGTCCAYAFTKCVVEAVGSKYHVHFGLGDFLAVVKIVCPCWNGAHPRQMVKQFNAATHVFIEDCEQK